MKKLKTVEEMQNEIFEKFGIWVIFDWRCDDPSGEKGYFDYTIDVSELSEKEIKELADMLRIDENIYASYQELIERNEGKILKGTTLFKYVEGGEK
ncbi:MAG: hypothetical protein ACTSV7_15080 [Candidatus Baldrarchaeia archaeon]